MPVRDEIIEVVMGAAHRALVSRKGQLSSSETQRLCSYFEARTPLYTGRYPILGLLQEMQSSPDAGIDGQSEDQILGWNDQLGAFTTPIGVEWSQAIQESASEATREHFRKATICFGKAQPLRAAEHLASGVVCSIAAIAALKGWPHLDGEDDLFAVVGLATGQLPQNTGQIYALLQAAPAEGQDLNSAYAAAMGQPDQVRYGFFHDGPQDCDEDAVLFAKRAVELASQLADLLP